MGTSVIEVIILYNRTILWRWDVRSRRPGASTCTSSKILLFGSTHTKSCTHDLKYNVLGYHNGPVIYFLGVPFQVVSQLSSTVIYSYCIRSGYFVKTCLFWCFQLSLKMLVDYIWWCDALWSTRSAEMIETVGTTVLWVFCAPCRPPCYLFISLLFCLVHVF